MPIQPPRSQQTLIDAIFHEQEQQLLKEFRARMEKMERREQLAQVSGIRDEAALDRLIALDIRPETLAVLEVIPLVLVAWADGKVQAEERQTIMSAANSVGIPAADGRYPLLEHWLKERPDPGMIEAWKEYIKGLCRQLDRQEIERLRHELLDRAQAVARAVGGFLGVGDKMSPAERAVLSELEQAFQCPPTEA